MKRRIIKQGYNTLTVTLPIKWTKTYHLKAGDEVDVIEEGTNLRINPNEPRADELKTEINITGLKIAVIWRLISSAYRAGYDEIKINYDGRAHKQLYTAFTYNTLSAIKDGKERQLSPLEAIQALVNRFVGFEIIDQHQNHCIIKDLGLANTKDFDNTVRRIFLLLQSMSDALMSAAKSGDYEGLRAVHIIDTNIDRFEDFCFRILNKFGHEQHGRTPTLYSIIFMLEMLGDEYKRIELNMLKIKKFSNSMLHLIELSDQMLRMLYENYYSFSLEKVDKIYSMHEKQVNLYEGSAGKIRADEKQLAMQINRMGKFMLSLTELRMDLELQKK